MLAWRKVGKIFSVENISEWMWLYSALPTPEKIDDRIIRVYFSCRDKLNRSHIAYFDFDIKKLRIKKISKKPVLSPGNPGYFDDMGCSVGCIVDNYLYYLGWNTSTTVPFRNAIGLAVRKGSRFEKLSGPIIDRSPSDPFSLSYPYVMKREKKYLMFYGTNVSWYDGTTKNMSYTIKLAISEDGINWNRKKEIFRVRKGEKLARPWLFRIKDGKWYMLFSRKLYDGPYHLEYAVSDDLENWRKEGKIKILGKFEDWDSEMCYTSVFEYDEKIFMFYSGRRYGLGGIGLCLLEDI